MHLSCVCVCVQDVYVIAMEYLLRENYSLLDTVDDVSVWTLSDIKVELVCDCSIFHQCAS